MALSEAQIRRYSRHILLPDVGGTGQARLLAATVSIDLSIDTPAAIAAATYLAAAGLGTLVLSGDRPVTPADLRTGIALGTSDLGRPLAAAVTDRLRALNPDLTVRSGAVPCTASDLRFESANDEPRSRAVYDTARALVDGGREAVRVIREITG
jgi:adenylyltransferase/sulfurtransferase